MYIIKETEIFAQWLENLTDSVALLSILARIERAKLGNFGDYKSVGKGVFEMRINKGKGYRIYYAKEADMAYLLISGGDKSNQHKDIQTAKMLWQQIKNEAQYD